MRFVVAMDSFKGSITSLEAGEAVKRGILAACPDATVTVLPLADGGEGTLDCIAPFIRGEEITLTVKGPLGEPVSASYIYDSADKVAYIEMARASGLTLVDPKHLDAVHASSYGTGELILDAIHRGARSVTVFIGGSATSDGGAGMLQAMGARFLDKKASLAPLIGEKNFEKIYLRIGHPRESIAKQKIVESFKRFVLSVIGENAYNRLKIRKNKIKYRH